MEYLHCLLDQSISPRQFLLELMINLCVRTGRLYQLQQYLQYHVITDSKPLACLLLSLESLYPPSRQMALDMMARLGTATNEITEILLDNGNIVTALNFGRETCGEFVMRTFIIYFLLQWQLTVVQTQCRPGSFLRRQRRAETR